MRGPCSEGELMQGKRRRIALHILQTHMQHGIFLSNTMGEATQMLWEPPTRSQYLALRRVLGKQFKLVKISRHTSYEDTHKR